MPPDHDLIAAFHEVQEFRQLRLGTVRADVQGTLWFISWIDSTTASRLNVAQEDRPCLKCRFGNAAPEIGAGGWPATSLALSLASSGPAFESACYDQCSASTNGPVAQLGARLNGIQEVTGSIPVRSTNLFSLTSDDVFLYCGRRPTPVGECQPVGELLCSLIRGGSVERHHGGRDARRAHQLCAPAIADEHHLDEVRAPADGLFEAMNGHGVCSLNGRWEAGRSYASRAADQAKGHAKAASTTSRM